MPPKRQPTFQVENCDPEGSILDSWSLRMNPNGCPETSVRNYHKPEGRSSHLLRGGSLKPCLSSS